MVISDSGRRSTSVGKNKLEDKSNTNHKVAQHKI